MVGIVTPYTMRAAPGEAAGPLRHARDTIATGTTYELAELIRARLQIDHRIRQLTAAAMPSRQEGA